MKSKNISEIHSERDKKNKILLAFWVLSLGLKLCSQEENSKIFNNRNTDYNRASSHSKWRLRQRWFANSSAVIEIDFIFCQSRMNLTATLCQTRSPIFVLLVECEKIGDCIDRVAVKFTSLYLWYILPTSNPMKLLSLHENSQFTLQGFTKSPITDNFYSPLVIHSKVWVFFVHEQILFCWKCSNGTKVSFFLNIATDITYLLSFMQFSSEKMIFVCSDCFN